MCGSRKYPFPNHRGSLDILRRRSGLKDQNYFLKESMSLNWNFQRGEGYKPKTLLGGGGYGYFLEQHNAA